MLKLIDAELERFMEEDDGAPVVMLNLLRFQPDGGRERYATYLATARPLVIRYGAEPLLVGEGLPALSAEYGQSWIAVVLVRYPSRTAFLRMIQDPEYQATAGPLRKGSLIEAVLQPVRVAG